MRNIKEKIESIETGKPIKKKPIKLMPEEKSFVKKFKKKIVKINRNIKKLNKKKKILKKT